MNDTERLVIQIQDGQPINHPLTYSNFLLLFPDCPIQETPTNDVISPYGYEVFVNTPRPTFDLGPYVKNDDGSWTNTWVKTN